MEEYGPNDPDGPDYKRHTFLLALNEGVWENEPLATRGKSLKTVQGLKELHDNLSRIGDYSADLAFPQAWEFDEPSAKKLTRILEVSFKNKLSLNELRKLLLPVAIVKQVDTPAPRSTRGQNARLSVTS